MRTSVFTTLRQSLGALALSTMLGTSVGAQGLFDPVILVNEDVVTNYELDQRIRLLEVFRTPGDLPELAREQLVDDRLKLALMRSNGLQLDDGALELAMEEFAGRANLSLEDFLQVLAQNGVEQETLRDFVLVGTTWRSFIRQRFGRQAEPSEADITAALGQPGASDSGIEVLLSEIIIPAPPPQAQRVLAQAREISQITSTSAFEAQARRVSALPSRTRGGRLDWLPISNYPAGLRTLLLSLAPGEVTPPIPITNGVALFQMRAVREVDAPREEPSAIDYAAFYIDGGLTDAGRQQAANVAARVDTCDDLYGVAQGLPEEQLDRQTLSPAELPQDFAIELAKMDPGEVSAVLTRNDGQTLVFLMLCERVAAGREEVDREQVAGQLRSQRLNGYADALIADLRASATIVGE